MSEQRLLPCPFCDGEAEIEQYGDARKSTRYCCMDCGCSLETGEEFNYGYSWNRRPAGDIHVLIGVLYGLKDFLDEDKNVCKTPEYERALNDFYKAIEDYEWRYKGE